MTRVLRYPLCQKDVVEALLRRPDCPSVDDMHPELPRRIFRPLAHDPPSSQGWKGHHEPLPFLQYLFSHPRIASPDPDSHEGYPLTRAVYAGFIPLIQFLLDHGASPRWKNGLAVLLAIQRKDLPLVKMLVERDSGRKSGTKKRKLTDRLKVHTDMLKVAVKSNARDIVDYLIREKGCVPDIKTLGLIGR